MTVVYRQAGLVDLEVLARLNGGLQRDEGGLRRLDDVTLRQRMADWLSSEYQAVLAERDGHSLGYALFRLEEATIFLRHLYVAPEARRQGLAAPSTDICATTSGRPIGRSGSKSWPPISAARPSGGR